jgi:hypothetical protein
MILRAHSDFYFQSQLANQDKNYDYQKMRELYAGSFYYSFNYDGVGQISANNNCN